MLEAIRRALAEDIGSGDHTTLSSVPPGLRRMGRIWAKDSGVVAGVAVAMAVFAAVDPELRCTVLKADGEPVAPGDAVLEMEGAARSILLGERVALNFMQRMSGIASRTAGVVRMLEGTRCQVLDTRKTTPGLREFEKWAVRLGGGVNHRMGLYDMILLKDNHVDYAGSMTAALEGVGHYLEQSGLKLPVVVEVRNEEEARDAIAADDRWQARKGETLLTRLLLDNHSIEETRRAVATWSGRIPLESSGGITPFNVRAYAETGVDYVSMGSLTHSVPALDLSLKSWDLA